jgi:hypothetical protein
MEREIKKQLQGGNTLKIETEPEKVRRKRYKFLIRDSCEKCRASEKDEESEQYVEQARNI